MVINYISKIQKGGSKDDNKYAIAEMRSHNGTKVLGYLFFDEDTNGTHIYGNLEGFSDLTSDGLKGFHIHSKGNTKVCCESLGGHYNPHKKTHGDRLKEDGTTINLERHLGDLGNIEIKNGKTQINIIDPLIRLSGDHSIIGRSIIIHSDQDDLGKGGHKDSKTTGNSGFRTAYGIISWR